MPATTAFSRCGAFLLHSPINGQRACILSCSDSQVTALLSNRRLPARGWDDAQIEYLLTEISLMDSNNFSENVGVGEREGRVRNSLVPHVDNLPGSW